MKRDVDLIHELLLKLETLLPNRIVRFQASDVEIHIDGHTPEEVFYHLGLLKEDALIHSEGSGRMGSIEFAGLTSAGHNLLASLRSNPLSEVDNQPSQPTTTMKAAHLQQDIQRGITRLQERIDALKAFDFQVLREGTMPELAALSAAIADTLERCFGKDTTAYRRYKAATVLRPIQPKSYGNNEFYLRQEARENFERSVALLQDAQRALREDLEDAEHAAPQPIAPAAALSRRVFVVHGHDEGAREAVARFLEKIDFEAIILHEKANQGRTVIEKIEAHGNVGFAVVLLTPDDVGSVKDGTPEPRARQNVLLELGYFIGRLGRGRVCALKRGQLEIPSDFAGVVWEAMDPAGGWKKSLCRELDAMGFDIDWKKAMQA
ncbi:TIR domain-containing protein [Burkholderia gladioli]|uniref:TIR domain-containing protein n=1 Tax=Burkholderia gladioli TaxID=28095 RepID=UPI00163ECE76|nr:TIR domain-containing protein [Burkholderia gladioli]